MVAASPPLHKVTIICAQTPQWIMCPDGGERLEAYEMAYLGRRARLASAMDAPVGERASCAVGALTTGSTAF